MSAPQTGRHFTDVFTPHFIALIRGMAARGELEGAWTADELLQWLADRGVSMPAWLKVHTLPEAAK